MTLGQRTTLDARTTAHKAQFIRFGQCCVIGAALGMFVVVVAIVWGIL